MVLFNLQQSNSILPVASEHSRLSPWLLSIVYPLGCRVVMPTFFGQITVIGQENIPRTGPVILAPTHRARWDALLVPYATGRFVSGRDLRFMVTVDEVKGLQGWLIRRLGGFPVNPRQPGIASLRYGVEILRNGEMLVIFPEGGIFRDQQIHPLKPGLARLALQAEAGTPGLDVKIVPINLDYSQSPPGWGSDVTIRIGEPLQVSHYMQGSTKQEAQRLTRDLESALRQVAEPELTPIELSVYAN